MIREFITREGRTSGRTRLFTRACTLGMASVISLTVIAGISMAGDGQSKTIEFEGKTWVAGLAKEVTVADYKGKKAMHVVGGEQSYVYLPEVEFQDGIIEVDIAGAIFSGIGFRGSENGKRLEKVYFRPQNAGTAKHANTVQYAVIGRKDGTWRYLRTNFPGKYETGADIKKDEWFHVRLVIRGAEVKVYVDEKPEPVLTVDKMLDGTSKGTVGVWGWNSYFANFHFTPASVGGVSQAAARDWPQWRGPNRDGKAAGFAAPEEWPAQLTQKWKVTVGSGDSTPALVGDKLYVFTRQGDEEVTKCLNAASGGELWKDSYVAQAVEGAARRHPGPRSSPAVADGKVVTLGVGGVVSCLDAATGKLVWRKDPFPRVVPRFFTSFSPIIVDGMAIAHLGGKGNGAIIAYDLATGNEKWRWAGEGPDYGSPALVTVEGTRQIVTPTEQSIVGISVADGKLLWQFPSPPPSRAYNAATPIVDGQTVIYAAKGRGTKGLKIEKQGDAFAVEELWSNPDLATQYNTPVLQDGLLFGLSDDNKFFCIDAQTGKTAWTDATARGSGGFGAIVGAGSCLVALTNDSQLIVYKPDGTAYGQIRSYKVADTVTNAHPVMSGNRIFVKDQDSLALWMVP